MRNHGVEYIRNVTGNLVFKDWVEIMGKYGV